MVLLVPYRNQNRTVYRTSAQKIFLLWIMTVLPPCVLSFTIYLNICESLHLLKTFMLKF